MNDNVQQLHALVFGRVQGVNFRFYTQQKANELGLIGWVRNLPDGSVEVVAEGPSEQLEELLLFLQRGSASAIVSHVDYQWHAADGELVDFQVR